LRLAPVDFPEETQDSHEDTNTSLLESNGFQEDRICALDLLFHLKPSCFWPDSNNSIPCRQESRDPGPTPARGRSRGVQPCTTRTMKGISEPEMREGSVGPAQWRGETLFRRPRNSKVPDLRVGQTTMSFASESSSSTALRDRPGRASTLPHPAWRVLPHQQIGLRHSCEALCASRSCTTACVNRSSALSRLSGCAYSTHKSFEYNS